MSRYSLPRRAVGRALALFTHWPTRDDHFHFVRDYRRFVRNLLAGHPRDEAMSLAVGGQYEETGLLLADIMVETGLRDGMALLDLGCGSGRLAWALSRRLPVEYLGLDVVPELLAYARRRCPPDYRFALNRALTLPAPDAAFDRVCAFSVFTHLLHEESFLYLREALRVLKPGGAVVFSFLEFGPGKHWPVFAATVQGAAARTRGHLNVFIEAPVIDLWARALGFEPPVLTRSGDAGAAGGIVQSVALLRKPVSPRPRMGSEAEDRSRPRSDI